MEMDSCVRFPNCHDRQLQKPGLSSSLAMSIHLSARSNCQTSSLQKQRPPSATDIPLLMPVLAGQNLHMLQIASCQL